MNIETLKSLLFWVALGALFFWMVRRGGCGNMIARGYRGESGGPDEQSGMRFRSSSGKPVDPVCGMEIDPAKAAGTRLVGAHTYFFCSPTCLAAFDENPDAYTHELHEGHSQRRHAGCC